jgi:L-amino acid N-acyltransferase YncA
MMVAGGPVIGCGERHLPAIRAIFNDAIANTTALYEYEPRSESVMAEWFVGKQLANLPVLGIEVDGRLAGFATWGPFRPYPAYQFTVEHSVYVAQGCRRQGIGRSLLEAVIAAATERGLHLLVGGIDATNAPSIALHKSMGFSHAGTVHEAGFKFGRWLDLEFWQRRLES